MRKGQHHSEESKRKMSDANRGKCPSEEARQLMSASHCGSRNVNFGKFGDEHPMFGRHHSDESKKKMSESHCGKLHYLFGKHHSEETKRKISESERGKCYSNESRELMSAARRGKPNLVLCGERNPAWKGGVTPLVQLIRHSFKYRQWISDVFVKDDYTCQKCGERGVRLNAHHIKLFSQILFDNKITTLSQALECEKLWNVNNGKTLCELCHKTEHRVLSL
jgi:hypothetical protein